jgi:predicted porin
MKKSLIALAVAGAFVAPAAMADTTIYGQANVSFDAVNNGLTSGSSSTNHVASNQSRIGFKGAEDLGGGTSAVWQIEQQVNFDNGGQALATRNTFAGLTGESWGTAILGQHDTPYKIATRGLDLFADTIADNRSLMGMTVIGLSEDARLGDVAAYISPAMSGLTVAVATLAGAESATSGTTKGGAWSLAGLYGAGPLNASLAYQAIDVGTLGTGSMDLGGALPVNSKVTAWKLGGGYTMDAIQLNAVYEKLSSSGPISSAADRSSFYLGGKYSFGSDAVKLAYTSAGKINSGADTEATQLSVGYDHSLSKNTTAYALYTKLSNKANVMYGLSSAATSAGGTGGAGDADPSAWSLGLKHSF